MTGDTRETAALVRFHLQVAWWSLLCFVVLGVTLEGLHAWKVDDYLGKGAETRRLMWTLAHAHGTLLALLHAAFAFTCFICVPIPAKKHRIASAPFLAASALIPVGFFLGGMFTYENDPGLGIWLVPLGAGCLAIAVLITAMDVLRAS